MKRDYFEEARRRTVPFPTSSSSWLTTSAGGTWAATASSAHITGYTSISGLDLDSYQVHARCILLDTRTGYRSQFFAVSGVVSL